MSTRTLSRRPVAGIALLALAALSACGGGGDSTPAAATGSAAPPAVVAPATAPTGSTCGLPDFTASVLARVNQVRAGGADCGSAGAFGAAASLRWNDKLTAAADAHAKDMAALNYFSHTSADGRTLASRVDAAGYLWATLGENIAAGYPSVNAVMDGWVASPGHCANLMNPAFTEVGVVCVPPVAGDTYSSYWAMELGRPR